MDAITGSRQKETMVLAPQNVSPLFSMCKAEKIIEKPAWQNVQKIQNCLILCLKLYIWGREYVKEMAPSELGDLIAFTELEII